MLLGIKGPEWLLQPFTPLFLCPFAPRSWGANRAGFFLLSAALICSPFVGTNSAARASSQDALIDWQSFERQVRDGRIEKDVARWKLPEIMAHLKNYAAVYPFLNNSKWTFPVRGYDNRSVGGQNGDGFQPDIYYGRSAIEGYDFFDGNKHGGHPAHDIFVRDRNQDGLDDTTGKPIEIVTMTASLVIGVVTDWKPGSVLRGGNVAWLYNPVLGMIFYYAHLNTICVKPGEFLKQGAPIGTVGRTGAAANEKRSPTHLHLMVLKYDSGSLTPYDFYKYLADNRY